MFSFLKSWFPSIGPVSQEEAMVAAARIDGLLSKAGTIAVFSKSYCPYCTRAKNILSSYKAVKPRLQVLELDTMGAEGHAIQEALAKKLGKSRVTVPQVFIGGQHVGGCDDLQSAQSTGKLEKLLEGLTKTEAPSS